MALIESEFEPASLARWQEQARRILKPASLESLVRHDEDGLAVESLYPVEAGRAGKSHGDAMYLPVQPARRVAEGWRVCQPIGEGEDACDVDEALASGATALMLGAGAPDRLAAQLGNVTLPAIGIALDGDAATPDCYKKVVGLAGARDGDSLDIDLGLDPVAGLDAGLGLHAKAAHGHRLFRIDGWRHHNLGLTPARELGFVMACAAHVLRGAEESGVAAKEIAGRMSVRIALEADMFTGIVKCRALRRLFDGLLSACGADGAGSGLNGTPSLFIHGFVSLRMMSLLDSEVNMLRTTTALLGGAIGGADLMVGFGHDVISGESRVTRRRARLAQVMMLRESALAESLDPVAGAPFAEARTEQLAREAWNAFQEIEKQGGVAAAIATGAIDEQARTAADARMKRLCGGDVESLGVTLQPRQEKIGKASADMAWVRRPVARIEELRRITAKRNPRVLLIRGDGDVGTLERRTRACLAIAGIQPVAVKAGDDKAIKAARADCIIGCGIKKTQAFVMPFIDLDASALTEASDKIDMLERLVEGDGKAGTR